MSSIITSSALSARAPRPLNQCFSNADTARVNYCLTFTSLLAIPHRRKSTVECIVIAASLGFPGITGRHSRATVQLVVALLVPEKGPADDCMMCWPFMINSLKDTLRRCPSTTLFPTTLKKGVIVFTSGRAGITERFRIHDRTERWYSAH